MGSSESLRPQASAYNALLGACAACSACAASSSVCSQGARRNWGLVLAMLEQMRRRSAEADVVTYDAALRTCSAAAGPWARSWALGLLRDLQSLGVSSLARSAM